MIYFIQGSSGGPIKIGKADFPLDRLAQLQTAHHERLILLAVAPGGRGEELALHARFFPDRCFNEWFSPSPTLLAFIEEAKAVVCAEPLSQPEPEPDEEQLEAMEAARQRGREITCLFHGFLTEFYAGRPNAARDIAAKAEITVRQASNWLSGKSMPNTATVLRFAMSDPRMAIFFQLTMDATGYAMEHKVGITAAMKTLMAEGWTPWIKPAPELGEVGR